MIGPIYLTLLELSIMLFLAAIFRSVAQRAKIPGIVPDILVGLALGPSALGGVLNSIFGVQVFQLNDYTNFLAEFAVVLLIFAAGLEHGMTPLRSAGALGALGATAGALAPFIAAYYIFAGSVGMYGALLLGLSLAATSLAAAAAILLERGVRGAGASFLTAAAAIDDVVTFILLSVVLGVISSGSFSTSRILNTTIYYTAAWLTILAVSLVSMSRISKRIKDEYAYEFSLVVVFGLVAAMTALGFSPIIAAFIGGVAVAEGLSRENIKKLTEALLQIFGPLFFIIVGAESDVAGLGGPALIVALELTAIGLAFKALGVFPFAYLYTRDVRAASAIAAGMLPRGETGLAIAAIGLKIGLLDRDLFTAVVVMTLLTTITGATAFNRVADWLYGSRQDASGRPR